jgi:ABC-type multidrug transport system ATPase subunit
MHTEVRALTKTFGGTVALDNVSLRFAPGEIVAVIGLNGAGKSTLLNCLAGVLAPSRGEVRHDDRPFTRDRLDVRRRLMFFPDNPVLFGDHTLLDHLALLFRLYERPTEGIESRLVDLMAEFDVLALAEARLATLSRGQIYKCGLVALLGIAPQLWLLDEPFASGMDPHGLATFRRHARAAASECGATVVYTTQILEVAQKFCDRLIVLNRGRVERELSAAELAAHAHDGALDALLESFRETPA